MKSLHKIALVSGLGIATMLGSGSAISAAKKTFITIGTGGPTGVYFVSGNAICRMIHKEAAEGRKKGRKHGIRCSAPSSAGSTYNIAQITEGEFDFGVAQSDWQYHSYNGSSKKVTHNKDLRAVFSVHPEPYQLIAAKGSGIKSWKDMKGKSFNMGNPGSGQRATTELLMERYKTPKNFFKLVTEMTSSEHSKALCDGKIDAFGYVVGIPNSGVSVATEGCGAYIVDLNTDVEKGLIKEFPFYGPVNIPKGAYSSVTAPVTTFGGYATIVSSAKVAEDVVYEVVRAVFENLDDFKKLHPAYSILTPQGMIKNGNSAPLHPGAVKYYKEKGLM
jgi:TRAP transporter TAXI family solute receptor